MTKENQTPIFIITDELNNFSKVCYDPKAVDEENLEGGRMDPSNNTENVPSPYTLMGNSPEGDYLPSWYSSLSEDTGVNNNSLSPSKSSACLKMLSRFRPIKEAPPGIKYAYCSCNCLRVVKGEIEQTKCMRPECGKTVTIPPSPVHVSKENSTIGTENLVGIYVKCPRCGKLSYFEEEKSSGWTSLIIYSSMFALEIVVFVILVVKIPFLIRNPVFYVVYIGNGNCSIIDYHHLLPKGKM
ncbi:hypothetical protein Avbf_02576 [Armadillidium vulgare]|nr:hypothetical protein Avbf_02576 [Armadillidium vulgare]